MYMKTSFELPKEYPNTNFTLYKELAVNESIAANRNLFKTISISHDDKGNAIEKKPMIFAEIDLKNKNQHKLESCIALNNEQHQRAWNMFLTFNNSNYGNTTKSVNNIIKYLDNVLLLFESWFHEHDFSNYLNIKRIIHNKSFRSIKVENQTFVLTEQQALAIKYLYNLMLQGVPSTTSADVIRHIDESQGIFTTKKRLVDVFKRNKMAYKVLIEKNSDTIKLKIGK